MINKNNSTNNSIKITDNKVRLTMWRLGHCSPWTGGIPLTTVPIIKTKKPWIRANAVRNITKYSISAFNVDALFPTSPLIGKRKWKEREKELGKEKIEKRKKKGKREGERKKKCKWKGIKRE